MTDDDKAYWLSWCIEEYASEKNKSSTEISKMFEEKGVLSYLDDNAEILHTQGKNYILSDIDEFLKNRKNPTIALSCKPTASTQK